MVQAEREEQVLHNAQAVSPEQDCYVLFDTHTDAMALFQTLKNAGVGARISPTPRMARTTCGVSLLVACTDRERIESVAAQANLNMQAFVALPRQIDPTRDQYC